jgi:ubiquinone/menaquinone biosynthesis C-methylase UbiE
MWESSELTDLVDFNGKTVIDLGSGTGRLALIAAPLARTVFAVEPVGNLRCYIKDKTRRQGFENVYPVDGTNTAIPFPDYFADVTMSGHVFGDLPEEEYQEMERVTRPGGMLILCPGTSRKETRAHEYLLTHDFEWAEFEEPGKHIVRKYWKTL